MLYGSGYLYFCFFMKSRFIYFAVLMLLCFGATAQVDTSRIRDTTKVDSPLSSSIDTLIKKDSVKAKAIALPILRFDTAVFGKHPFYTIKNPLRLIISRRNWEGKDAFFYTSIGLLLFFALVRNTFGRYLQDLIRLFFRTSIKHRQVKDQLMQAPMPSLLLNILFFISGGLFLTLVFERYGWGSRFPFWVLFFYSVVGLACIYFVKFISLKVSGWVFKLSDAINAYIFIVFTTNKIIGITLLPMIVLLTFTSGAFSEAVLNLSFLLVGLLFMYRFYLSYVSIQRQLRVQFFHFAIYFCAFEIIPLLLINKLLFQFLSINA